MDKASEEIDRIAHAFFSAFDNRGGRKADTSQLYGLFIEGALIVIRRNDSHIAMDLPAFINPRAQILSDGVLVDFHEWEEQDQTQVYGGIALRSSLYRKQGTWNGEAYSGTGRKLFQFLLTPQGWKISSLLWQDD